MTDAQLAFFNMLHTTYSTQLFRCAYRYVNDRWIAQDLVQEVFAAASKKIAKIQQYEQPERWLKRAITLLIQTELAKPYRAHEVPEATYETAGKEPFYELPIKTEIAFPPQIKQPDRQLLLLRYDKELSTREIAELLGIKDPACRKKLSRALSRCRKFIEENLQELKL